MRPYVYMSLEFETICVYVRGIFKWGLIAGRLPGRTALAVKNYWNTKLNRKILHHHRHVVKPHCTHAARFSLFHPNGKTKGLISSERQPHNSHDGPHIRHGIAEAETKSTVNPEMNSLLPPVDMATLEQKCMILPDPGSLPADINNVILPEEDTLSKQSNFLSDDELMRQIIAFGTLMQKNPVPCGSLFYFKKGGCEAASPCIEKRTKC